MEKILFVLISTFIILSTTAYIKGDISESVCLSCEKISKPEVQEELDIKDDISEIMPVTKVQKCTASIKGISESWHWSLTNRTLLVEVPEAANGRIVCTKKISVLQIQDELHTVSSKWESIMYELSYTSINNETIRSIPFHIIYDGQPRSTQSKDLLDIEKISVTDSDQYKLREMLILWFKWNPNPIWNDIIEALRSPTVDEHELADKIERKYCHPTEFVGGGERALVTHKVKMKEAYREILPAKNRWFEIGLELDLDLSVLLNIRMRFLDNSKALLEMLKLWRSTLQDRGLPMTWHPILAALRSRTVNESWLADEIEEKYCQKEDLQDKDQRGTRGPHNDTVAQANLQEGQDIHPQHLINDRQQLYKETAEVGDWEVLCSLPGVERSVLVEVHATSTTISNKKKRCLDAYFDSSDKVHWEDIVHAIASYPLYNVRLAKNIAKNHGVEYDRVVMPT